MTNGLCAHPYNLAVRKRSMTIIGLNFLSARSTGFQS